MAIKVKPGNGGHGYEAYDDSDGKYAKVEIDLGNGTKISTYDEFLSALMTPQQKQMYDNDPNLQQQVDNMFGPTYKQMLEDAISKMGNPKVPFFNSVDDFMEKGHEIFDEEFVDFLINEVQFDKQAKFKHKDKKTSTSGIRYALERLRFGKDNNKMIKITEAEYQQKIANFPKVTHNTSDSQVFNLIKTKPYIPVWRGKGCDRANQFKEWNYNVDPKETKPLATGTGGNWGDVIYMSTNESYSKSYYGGLMIHGVIDMSKCKNVAFFYGDRSAYGMLREFRTKSNLFITNLKTHLSKNPKLNTNQIDEICRRTKGAIDNDIGTVCALMGYDAVYGDSLQLDPINPSIVLLSDKYY